MIVVHLGIVTVVAKNDKNRKMQFWPNLELILSKPPTGYHQGELKATEKK